MLREVPGRLESGSCGGGCRGCDETGAAGGFEMREVTLEESRAGTGSEGVTTGGTARVGNRMQSVGCGELL